MGPGGPGSDCGAVATAHRSRRDAVAVSRVRYGSRLHGPGGFGEVRVAPSRACRRRLISGRPGPRHDVIAPASAAAPTSRSRCSARTRRQPARRPALAAVPTGFTDQVTLTGLTHPTVIQFAPDGRVFVAEKSGLIKVFDSLTDTTPDGRSPTSARKVDDYWDRGLLGLALAPNFPTNPYVYVLYTYDAPIGGTAPVWNDACPSPPGPTTDGCVVSGRLSRLQASGDVMHRARAGAHQRLVPAVPEPLDRHGRVRARRRALRERRRRRELQRRRLRPVRRHGRQPDARQPVRGSDERGRGAAEPGPADDAQRRRRRRHDVQRRHPRRRAGRLLAAGRDERHERGRTVGEQRRHLHGRATPWAQAGRARRRTPTRR